MCRAGCTQPDTMQTYCRWSKDYRSTYRLSTPRFGEMATLTGRGQYAGVERGTSRQDDAAGASSSAGVLEPHRVPVSGERAGHRRAMEPSRSPRLPRGREARCPHRVRHRPAGTATWRTSRPTRGPGSSPMRTRLVPRSRWPQLFVTPKRCCAGTATWSGAAGPSPAVPAGHRPDRRSGSAATRVLVLARYRRELAALILVRRRRYLVAMALPVFGVVHEPPSVRPLLRPLR